MDPDHFDSLARTLGAPTSRRAALGTTVAAGLLGALGLGRAVPEARAAQGGTCVLAFTAQVLQGPSAAKPLTPNAAQAGEVRGDLSFSLSKSGNLDNATLTLPDGTQLPVVGQATGHSLQLRIELGPRLALVALGVGVQEITACRGAIDGVATGPQSGDLGGWHAAGVQQTGGGGQGADETAAQGAAAGSGGAAGGARTDRGGRGGRGATESGSASTAADSTQADTQSTGSGSTTPSCASGETYCSYVEECRNLSTSPLDCGTCGTRCPSLVCQGGRCLSEDEADQVGASVLNCTEGLISCDGACVDPLTDTDHCGTCGNTCPVSPLLYDCEGGVCVPPSCGSLTPCGALCVDPLTDPLHCGACDAPCAVGTTCQDGACVTSGGGGCLAGSGLTYCGGVCVDLSINAANCGACGVSCGGLGGVCTGGVCGGCGVVCPEGTSCQNGVCVAADGAGSPPTTDGLLQTCEAQGLTDCAGICVDLHTDPANCGGCGVPCDPGMCTGGVCQVSAAASS